MKKIICVILSMIMLLSIVTPLGSTALAASKPMGNQCGDNVYWKIDSNDLVIYGTGPMWDFSELPYTYRTYDKYANNGFRFIIIENGVTRIGSDAFRNIFARGLSIADTVTSIGSMAFCQSISCYHHNVTVSIPDSVVSIEDKAFASSTFTALHIGKNVRSIANNAFDFFDNKLLEISVDPNNRVYDSRNNCNALIDSKSNTLLIGSANTVIPNGVTAIAEEAFLRNDKLVKIDIPDSVISIGDSAFRSCKHLHTIRIGKNVKTIGDYAFEDVAEIYGSQCSFYYKGSKAQWNKINIGINNENLTRQLQYILEQGWMNDNGNWYYYSNYDTVKGWKKINGKWYLFNSSGIMLSGWQNSQGKRYYLNSSGAMVTGWQNIKSDSQEYTGPWYYFNSSGAMVTGWKKIKGKWYYFDSSGQMVRYWKRINNKWYYFNSEGAMCTGWNKIYYEWYYFNSNGDMRTANLTQGGKTYKFTSSGACINP